MKRSDTGDLWASFSASRCPKAREKLILAYQHLVYLTLARLRPAYSAILSHQDYVSEGTLGLIHAVDCFEPERGIQFETYAITSIRYAMIEAMRGADWLTRAERARVRAGEEEPIVVGLDTPAPDHPDVVLSDILIDPEEPVAEQVIRQQEAAALWAVVGELPDREALAIRLYYVEDLTHKQVGERLGVSETRALQLNRQALKRLRKGMEETSCFE
jgi:RNA polymerase sigma factor for flagellar operon FliA